jgi:hypothetical protein
MKNPCIQIVGGKPSTWIQEIEILKNLEILNKNKMEKRGGPNWTCFCPLFWTLLGSFKLNLFYSIILTWPKTFKL